MKILVTDYIFNPTAKTITFQFTPSPSGMLLITNITDGIIIYNFADPTSGGVFSNNILTLTYNTSSMSATDNLQIYYDNAETSPTELAGEKGYIASAIFDRENNNSIDEILSEVTEIKLLLYQLFQ